MSRLRVQVLGGLSVLAAGRGALPIARSCRALLGYLLTQRQRPVSRIELAETIWSHREGEYARRCLSTAIWRLKQSAGPGSDLLSFGADDAVGFNWVAAHWVDAMAFEWRIAPFLRRAPDALGDQEIARAQRGLRLYCGDYLSGMDQEWALLERQRLRTLFCDGMYHLMTVCAARGAWSQVLEWGRRLSREEPLREDVHRLLMQALVHSGNRASALALYRECAERLAAELGVRPMPETQALHASLANAPALLPPVPVASAAPIEKACRRIGRVQRALAASQRQLDSALLTLSQQAPKQH